MVKAFYDTYELDRGHISGIIHDQFIAFLEEKRRI
jgi:hypothetical protein